MKQLKELKTVIFDMDGTALNDQKEMDKLLIAYRNEIKAAGVTMMIASGRLDQMVYNYMNELELDSPIIGSNGATITYQNGVKPAIFSQEIAPADMQQLIDLAVELDATYHVFTLHGLYGAKNEGRLAYYSDSNESKDTEEQVVIGVGDKYTQTENLPDAVKFLLVTEDRAVRDQFEVLANALNLESAESGDNLFDIMAPGISKGNAINVLVEKGIIDLETTLVFGDNFNDVEMLEAAKYPIVMENAADAIKAYAWDIAPLNNDSGVGQYVLDTLGIPYKK